MKKFLSLVKLLFIQQYRAKPTNNTRKKRAGTIALIIVLAICMLPMFISLAIGTYKLGEYNGASVEICGSMILICQALVLFFGLPMLISNVFTAKDASQLLYLPMRSSTIFVAKLTVAYINEVITSAFTVIFLLLPYGIGANASAGFYFILLLAIFFIPMLPLLVGSIVALPFSVLIEKLGKNGIVKTILQVILFAGIMTAYLFFINKMSAIENVPDDDAANYNILQVLSESLLSFGKNLKYIHSNYALSVSLFALGFGVSLLWLLISVAENAVLFGLLFAVALPFYRWLLSSSLESSGARRKKAGKADVKVENKGVVKSLVITDLKRVLRDSQIGFQSLIGLIIVPIILVMFYFSFSMGDEESLIALIKSEPMAQTIVSVAIFAYMSLLSIGSNVLGIYPITRENNAFYLIKSMPIRFEKYLLSKVILSTALILITDFLTCLLIVLLLSIQWYVGLLMWVAMVFVGFGGMCITTLIDLKSPKIGWTNFNQSLKNARNSWISMLIGFIISLVVGIISILFIMWSSVNSGWYVAFIMWLTISVAAAVFAVVCYKIMTGKAQRYFERIEP